MNAIESIKNEIETAEIRIAYFRNLAEEYGGNADGITQMKAQLEIVIVESYIKGLQTALRLMTESIQ